MIVVLWLNDMFEPSLLGKEYKDLINQDLTISPFTLYLYLNPLYSSLGGSTIRAELFINKPGLEDPLLNPLYRWKILTQQIFVLSDT